MNSALMSRESGAWLFHVTLDARGNGVGERVVGEDRRGEHTRARRWGKAGEGKKGV